MITTTSKFVKQGRFLVKETYDSSGRISVRQYFNKDTVPDGQRIEYYSNGIIAKWEFYQSKYNNPTTGVFYNKQGGFDSLLGDVFLDVECCTIDNDVLVKSINPPQTGIRLLYKDKLNDKIVFTATYKPILTDTCSLFILKDHKYTKEHKYEIYFYVADTIKRTILYQDSLEVKEFK